MLGAKLARDKNLRIGSTVRLAGRDYAVVGIGRLRGFGFSGDSFGYSGHASFDAGFDHFGFVPTRSYAVVIEPDTDAYERSDAR